MPACPRPGVYVPRQTHDCDAAVLVRRHLPGFLARLEEGGHTLPEFVKAELEGFAGCGDFEKGFVLPACCVVGRSPVCDLLVSDRTVSAQHAVIQWTGSAWTLRDLGSRNGTYAGETRLVPGAGSAIGPGAQLRFGRARPGWELVEAAGPQLMAVNLETGEIRRGEGGYLVLPDAETAEHAVYQDASGAWVDERRGEPMSLVDRELVLTDAGTRWRIHLPTAVAATFKDSDDALLVASLRLRFGVSRDEEHVELVATCGDHRLDLQARAHHYPLLVLARQRLADLAAGVPEGEQGWLHPAELSRMLRMDDNHINICIHRARTQLGRLGVLDPAALVERRSGSRQLRIGVARLEVASLDDPGR